MPLPFRRISWQKRRKKSLHSNISSVKRTGDAIFYHSHVLNHHVEFLWTASKFLQNGWFYNVNFVLLYPIWILIRGQIDRCQHENFMKYVLWCSVFAVELMEVWTPATLAIFIVNFLEIVTNRHSPNRWRNKPTRL